MSKFLIDSDPVSGMFSTFHYDAGEDKITITAAQYLDKLLEQNRRDANEVHGTKRYGDGFGRQVASIPLQVFFPLYQKGIVRDRKAFRRWLNDYDNRHFRTAPGTV